MPAIEDESSVVGDVPPAELGPRAIRGGAVSIVATFIQSIATFVIMAIMTRLLSPEDFGLMGMVFAVSSFGQVFSDMGLSSATIQKRSLTQAQLSTIFWLNLGLSIALSGAAVCIAPGIGWFYGDSRLVPLAMVSALTFVSSGMGTQHLALMARRMQFGRLAICDLGAAILGGLAGIAMAWRGWGPYALAGQAISQALSRSIAAWVLSKWIPGRPELGSDLNGMIRFGGYLTAFSGVNYFARNADKVILGWYWGAVSVGIYSRAYALMMWPIVSVSGPIMKVMMPALARIQDDRERFQRVHLRIMTTIALITFPIGGGLAVIGGDVVLALYGDRWRTAIDVFRILSLSAIFQPWMSSLGGLYMSVGRTRDMWIWGCIASGVLVTSMILSVSMGVLALATASSLALILLVPFALWFATSRLHISLANILKAGVGPLAATFVMMVTVSMFRHYLVRTQAIPVKCLAEVMLGTSTYVLASLVLARPAVRDSIVALGLDGWRTA